MPFDPPGRLSDLFAWLTCTVEPSRIAADVSVVRLPVTVVADDDVMVLGALAERDHVPWVEF